MLRNISILGLFSFFLILPTWTFALDKRGLSVDQEFQATIDFLRNLDEVANEADALVDDQGGNNINGHTHGIGSCQRNAAGVCGDAQGSDGVCGNHGGTCGNMQRDIHIPLLSIHINYVSCGCIPNAQPND